MREHTKSLHGSRNMLWTGSLFAATLVTCEEDSNEICP